MTTRADWLRNQIAWAENVLAKIPATPFGDGGFSHHIDDLKAELAEEIAAHPPPPREDV